jgi:hypothetical protein
MLISSKFFQRAQGAQEAQRFASHQFCIFSYGFKTMSSFFINRRSLKKFPLKAWNENDKN